MRTGRMIALLLSLAVAVISAASLAGCGEKREPVPIKISIIDRDQSIPAEGTDDMRVKALIEGAGLTVDRRDTVIPGLDVVWREAGESAIVIRRYAKAKVIDDETGKKTDVELIGGTVDRAIKKAGYEPAAYKTDVDKKSFLTDGMEIHLTGHEQGLIEAGGKAYFYDANGQLLKGGVVGNEASGYYYADDNGAIDRGYCDGVTVGGSDYVVINGAAAPVMNDSDSMLFCAAKAIAKCTDSSMGKREKLRAAFDYIKTAYLEGVRHDPPYREADWPVVCASDLFVYGKGDCFSYGAAYAYMAKAIGCDEVYACNTGGHGWAEVEGKFYDPEWDMHNSTYNHFGVSPGDECDVNYVTSIQDGADWMRVKL